MAVSSHQTAPAGPCIQPESLQLWGKDRTLGEVNNSMVRISTSQAAGRRSTDHRFLTERRNRKQHNKASGRGADSWVCRAERKPSPVHTSFMTEAEKPGRARSCLASQTRSLRVLTRLRMRASVLRLPRVINQEFKAPSTVLGTRLVLSDADSPAHPFSKLNRDQKKACTGSTEGCAQRRDTTQT